MSAFERIIACSLAGILWLGAIVAKHFWSDIDIGAFCAACAAVITAIGIHGAATGAKEPTASAQGGFARPLLLALIALGALSLAGCASLTDAGHSAYSFKATADGCEATATDGKEFKERTIVVDCAKGQMAVNEGDAKAFKGQAIAAKALSVLPVTDLANILNGGGGTTP